MRLTIYFLIILPLIIFVSKPSYSGEDAVLLAMKLECGGNSAGRKPYNDYFFALTTDYTFQGNRYWIGKNKYEGDVGLNIFSGVRTDKSLLIKGEGKWLKKTSKDWKLQFISKGNKSMFEHLEAGVEGFEGKDKWRRECKLVLLNKVKADDAIQLDSYTKVISGLKNQIDNLKKREKDKENNQVNTNQDREIILLKNQIDNLKYELKKQESNTNQDIDISQLQKNEEEIQNLTKKYEKEITLLKNQIIPLKDEKEINDKKIKELNKELDKINKELVNNEEELKKNENKLLVYQEKVQTEIKRKEKEEEAKRIAIKLEEEKLIEEEKKKEERRINNLKYELGSSELVVAQNLINDLEEFIQNNSEEFDIVDIAELLLENKGIIDGVWEDNSQANYNKLSDFINKSDAFRSFNQTKEDERFALAMDQLNNEYELLIAKEKELEKLLNDNLTSEFASEIIDKIKFVRTTLEDYSLKELLDSNGIVDEFLFQILNRISEKELEISNKNDEIKRFNSNYKNLELLLSQNLTSEKSPFIIEKINSVKNLQTGNLNSTDLSIINVELEVFIEKVENNTLIPKKEEKKVVQNNVIKKNTSDQKFETEEKRESFVGGSNAISDFINDVKLGMQTNFNELTCEDVFNQVKGLQLQTAFGGSFDMIFFDEVILLEKNKDEIICESYITLSNNNKSWYDMKIYKKDGNIFYEVEPKTSSTKRTTIKPVSSNIINEEKLVIPSFDKLVQEKRLEFRTPFYACIKEVVYSEEDTFTGDSEFHYIEIGNQNGEGTLTVHEYIGLKKNDSSLPKIGDCFGFDPQHGTNQGYVLGNGAMYSGLVKLLDRDFIVDDVVVKPILKDSLTVTEYFDQNTLYESKIVNLTGKIGDIEKNNNWVKLSLFSEQYQKREYSLSTYLDSELWEEDKNYLEILNSLNIGDEISIRGIFEMTMWGSLKIDIIKILSINGLDILENKNQQTNSFEKIENGKVVFKIVYAEDYIKSLDFNDDFGEFSHYGNYVGCTYRIEITNNTDHKIKINTFKISTKDTKLFPDMMRRDALIQYREVIESGQSFVDRGMYKEGGPYNEVDQTKELPSQEQIDKWFLQYGCEAQRGNIYIKASDSLDSENIVFTKESGITEGNKNDYLIGSSGGVYPLMEKIILK